MNNENLKNDFIFFKNEILSDFKKIESKLADKLLKMNEIITQQNIKIENKLKDFTSKIELLSNQIHEKENSPNFENIFQTFKRKTEENLVKIDIRLTLLEKDFSNSCFKYDKMISNNLSVPGLIGISCPFDSLRPFLEFVNIKINELIKSKEKQTLDHKKYKEKLDSIINNNKTQLETTQKKLEEYMKNEIKQCDTNCIDRINIIEKRIEALRIENGKFSYELIERSKELKIKWEKLDNVEQNLNIRFDEEMEKYNKEVEKITKKVDKSKNEFNLIKLRFTELSDFIKDIRFRKNIFNNFQERRHFREMSNKIDFSKKQTIKKELVIEDKDKDKDNTNDILAPFDYYAHFGIDTSLKEEDEYIGLNQNNNFNNNENNINSFNNDNTNDNSQINNKQDENNNINNNINNDINKSKNNNINEINNNILNIIAQKDNNAKIINDEKDKSKNKMNGNILKNSTKNSPRIIIKDNNNAQTIKDNLNNNNKNINIINNNLEQKINNNNNISNISSNIINNKESNIIDNSFTKNLKIKAINLKENNKINKEINNIKDNKIKIIKNIKESKEKVKTIPHNHKEPTKINDLLIGAIFQNNMFDPNKQNLSQAYIIMKNRVEEIQKIKNNNNGKQELKYRQMSPPPSLKYDLNQSRNNNKNLNQVINLSNKDFKKGHLEDLYYSKMKKDKLNQFLLAPNSSLQSSSQDNIFLSNTSDKRKLPIIHTYSQRKY